MDSLVPEDLFENSAVEVIGCSPLELSLVHLSVQSSNGKLSQVKGSSDARHEQQKIETLKKQIL